MTTNNFTDKELIEYRKANFWRGFWTCFVLLVLPFGSAFIIFCNVIINLMK